tara:strand:+ start:197 stop:970 length:774 start_codon:yes stop_codon:yes gene_type:complete
MTKTLAVIPARLASSRFPNKPLEMILGIPMIAHCYYRAQLSKNVDKLILATPDKEIIELSNKLGFHAIMTSDKHERATERVCEVLDILKSDDHLFDNIILLQGDEPQINPDIVDNLIKEISESNNDVINLIHLIENEDLIDTNVVKAIINNDKDIINFSRTAIPANGKSGFRQLGMIAFKTKALEKFSQLKPSKHEIIESIDMMRFLDNDIKIGSFLTEEAITGVDEEHHISEVEKKMKHDIFINKYLLSYEKSINN